MVPASPLLTPLPPCGVAGEVGGINPADLYPKTVHSDCPQKEAPGSAFDHPAIIGRNGSRSFIQKLLRDPEIICVPVNHLLRSRAAVHFHRGHQ
jgi:hypothetical protein